MSIDSCQQLQKGRGAMRRLAQNIVSFLKNDEGPTAVEYAVMLALILVVCLSGIAVFGSTTNNSLTTSGQRIKSGS
jgi:pilus assembly protein Flp/PilA